MEPEPGEVTRLLNELKRGNKLAEEQLIQLVYDHLRQMARRQLWKENPGHSLQPTVLVHEAYIRLTRMQDMDWQSRNHFFAVCATMMRRIIVDHARQVKAKKRGDGLKPIVFDEAFALSPERPAEILALDDALDELAKANPRQARVIEMSFFAGMTVEEVGVVLDIHSRTVKRDLLFARVWLHQALACKP